MLFKWTEWDSLSLKKFQDIFVSILVAQFQKKPKSVTPKNQNNTSSRSAFCRSQPDDLRGHSRDLAITNVSVSLPDFAIAILVT